MSEEGLNAEEVDGTAGLRPYEGPELTPMQFEVLCRHVISRELVVPVATIKSGFREAPTMAGRRHRHQIDLWWTSTDGVCEYLVFANAKWQRSKVNLSQLMTLIGVQHDIHAQKAMLISNNGFTPGVVSQAREKGIALLIVRPVADLDVGRIPEFPRQAATMLLEVVASERITPVYTLHYVHKGFVAGGGGAGAGDVVGRGGGAAVGEGDGFGEAAIVRAPGARVVLPNKMMPGPGARRGPGLFGIRRK